MEKVKEKSRRQKGRKGMQGRKGWVYIETTCVAGAWFSWEGEEDGRGNITEASECLVGKCGCYSILEEKP